VPLTPALQKRFVELDGGVSRVAGLLDTLAAADRMQAAAARARADAMLSNGAAGEALAHNWFYVPWLYCQGQFVSRDLGQGLAGLSGVYIEHVPLSFSSQMSNAGLRRAGGGIQIEEVDVATPRGKVLARRLTAAVPFDEGLLVTGPNGSGALPLIIECKPCATFPDAGNHVRLG
jgi:hypothetical protein